MRLLYPARPSFKIGGEMKRIAEEDAFFKKRKSLKSVINIPS